MPGLDHRQSGRLHRPGCCRTPTRLPSRASIACFEVVLELIRGLARVHAGRLCLPCTSVALPRSSAFVPRSGGGRQRAVFRERASGRQRGSAEEAFLGAASVIVTLVPQTSWRRLPAGKLRSHAIGPGRKPYPEGYARPRCSRPSEKRRWLGHLPAAPICASHRASHGASRFWDAPSACMMHVYEFSFSPIFPPVATRCDRSLRDTASLRAWRAVAR